jgi:hypothetical protein
MSPMDSPGAEVDIETGEPIDPVSVAVEEKVRKDAKISRYISTYEDIVNDLAGEGGVTLKKVAAMYANRIDEIVRQDPECRAFQMIFNDLNINIKIGRKYANAKINEVEENIGKGI